MERTYPDSTQKDSEINKHIPPDETDQHEGRATTSEKRECYSEEHFLSRPDRNGIFSPRFRRLDGAYKNPLSPASGSSGHSFETTESSVSSPDNSCQANSRNKVKVFVRKDAQKTHYDDMFPRHQSPRQRLFEHGHPSPPGIDQSFPNGETSLKKQTSPTGQQPVHGKAAFEGQYSGVENSKEQGENPTSKSDISEQDLMNPLNSLKLGTPSKKQNRGNVAVNSLNTLRKPTDTASTSSVHSSLFSTNSSFRPIVSHSPSPRNKMLISPVRFRPFDVFSQPQERLYQPSAWFNDRPASRCDSPAWEEGSSLGCVSDVELETDDEDSPPSSGGRSDGSMRRLTDHSVSSTPPRRTVKRKTGNSEQDESLHFVICMLIGIFLGLFFLFSNYYGILTSETVYDLNAQVRGSYVVQDLSSVVRQNEFIQKCLSYVRDQQILDTFTAFVLQLYNEFVKLIYMLYDIVSSYTL